MSSKSSRTITKQQFTDGTTADGNRLDEAFNDVEQRVNHVRKGDIKRRWVQGQHVLNFWPMQPNAIDDFVSYYPFVVARNITEDIKVSISLINLRNIQGPLGEYNQAWIEDDPTDYVLRNEFRMKGFNHDVQERIYTSTHIFSKPSIIDGLSLFNHLDGSGIFDKILADLSGQRLTIAVLSDNPYSPENRNHNQILLYKKYINGLDQDELDTIQTPVVNSDLLTPYDVATPPATSPTGLQGAYINLENLDIHIHAGSRVRFMMGFDNLSFDSIHKFTFTATMTYLEEIK